MSLPVRGFNYPVAERRSKYDSPVLRARRGHRHFRPEENKVPLILSPLTVPVKARVMGRPCICT